MEADSLLVNYWELTTSSKLHIQTLHCFSVAISVKNKNIPKKRKLIKNKFDPVKGVHYTKRKDM